MMQQMGEYAPFIDPEVILAVNRIFLGASLILALLIIFPSLLSARIDDGYSSYTIVFIPLFIVDAFILILALIAPTNSHEDGEEPPLQSERNKRIVIKLAVVVYVSLFIVFQFLLCAKLDSIISLDWWAVFTPYLILEGINLIHILITTIFECREPIYDHTGNTETATSRSRSYLEVLSITINNFTFFIIRIAQLILIIIKIRGSDMDWSVVFTPTWILGGIEVITLAIGYMVARKSAKPEVYHLAVFKIVSFLIWGGLFFTFIGLLVSRLNTGVPKFAVVLIPVFIVLGLLFCCFCCCLPCAFGMARQSLQEEMAGDVPMEVTVVDSDHLIIASS